MRRTESKDAIVKMTLCFMRDSPFCASCTRAEIRQMIVAESQEGSKRRRPPISGVAWAFQVGPARTAPACAAMKNYDRALAASG